MSFERITRAGWPVVTGAVLGLVAGGFWTLAQPDRYRAEARVLVRGASGVVPAVQTLAESSILEQNVAQTLRLSRPPRVTAKTGEGGVLTLSVEAGSRDRARQIDAEAALVLTQLVAARFESGPRVEATVLDPAHPVEQTSPTPARNYLIAGLIGLGAGAAAAVALARRRGVPTLAGAVDPSLERRLRKRVDEVAKRERELAKRAGQLAAREREVENRRHELEAHPAPTLEQAPAPAPASEPEPIPAGAVAPSGIAGGWNVNDLQRVVDARSGAPPEQVEEWRTYLFFLREHAAADGSLPSQFESLVNDVFGDLFR